MPLKLFLISNIITLDPPKIILDPTMGASPGKRLSCLAIGTPPIHTALVLIRDFIVLVNTTNTASIKLYEEGNYTCFASSEYGTDVKKFVVEGERTWII